MKFPHPLHRSICKRSSARRYLSAFTLIELLVVMAIIGLMTTLVVPSLPAIVKSGHMNTAVSGLAGTMEQARQYAVSQNTYVWVLLNPNSSATGDSTLDVAVLASKSGIDPSPWSNYGSVPSAQIQMLGKAQTYSGIKFSEAGTFTTSQIPALPATVPSVSSSVNSPASDTAQFQVNFPSRTVNFTRAVQFTPTGQARNASNPINVIEFSVQPAEGANVDSHNVAVLRINGLTGQTMVYRP